MEGGFSTNPFLGKQEEPSTTLQENGVGFPLYGGEASATASPKRRKGPVQKRVVSVPMGDGEASKAKADGAPPSDPWAWRKYGQKPIKGSPYPRGYYRCSSSKGCPARKQVERSRVDPTMLLITYTCEHNHPHRWPISSRGPTSTHPKTPADDAPSVFSGSADIEQDGAFPDIEPLANDCWWFSYVGASPTIDTTLLDSPICDGSDGEVASMGEEDESLFADLGELPECSVVFRRGFFDRRRCSLREAPCCGSTG